MRGGGAHRAGLEGDVEGAAGEAFGAQSGAGGADGEEFGVGGGITQFQRAVAGGGEDGAIRPRNDRADGDFAAQRSSARLFKGARHMR
jgi:hypothetical protein